MLQPKACHRGLKPKAAFLGLEAVDGLMLFPLFYLVGVLFGHLLVAACVTIALALGLRLLKIGRLPGYSGALVQYLVRDPRRPALGRDRLATYAVVPSERS